MKPLRIALTGSEGQVARGVVEAVSRAADLDIVCLARPAFDLAEPATIGPAVAAARPDVVINAAAYTAVDDAERDEVATFAINSTGAGAVAAAAAEVGAAIIQLSTDYVFAGDASAAYVETDPTDPRSAYGRSKLAGEMAVLAANPRAIVVRTSWVYGPGGKNFVATMLRLAAQRDEIGVVEDQRGRPTYAPHLAAGLIDIARAAATGWHSDHGGVFHLAGADAMSWRAFAEAVFAVSRARGGPSARVRAIASADYPTAATRPANSILDCVKVKRVFGVALPGVEAGLSEYFARAPDVRPSVRGFK
jgi:dTDP-4-dehydrorhamnose reductase